MSAGPSPAWDGVAAHERTPCANHFSPSCGPRRQVPLRCNSLLIPVLPFCRPTVLPYCHFTSSSHQPVTHQPFNPSTHLFSPAVIPADVSAMGAPSPLEIASSRAGSLRSTSRYTGLHAISARVRLSCAARSVGS